MLIFLLNVDFFFFYPFMEDIFTPTLLMSKIYIKLKFKIKKNYLPLKQPFYANQK